MPRLECQAGLIPSRAIAALACRPSVAIKGHLKKGAEHGGQQPYVLGPLSQVTFREEKDWEVQFAALPYESKAQLRS